MPLFERMFGGGKQRVIGRHAYAVLDCHQPHVDFLKHYPGVSLSPLQMIFRSPSILADSVFMLEVVEESEEFCYFLCLWIVFNVQELPLDVLQARQPSYSGHLPDADIPVS